MAALHRRNETGKHPKLVWDRSGGHCPLGQ